MGVETIEWWADEKYKIHELENKMTGLKHLYARQVNSVWEYAITGWYLGNPTLECLFRAGKVIE